MRDALQTLFPQLEERTDGSRKRFRIPGGLDGFMLIPTADELAELRAAARTHDGIGGSARAALLRGLSIKIEAAIRPGIRRRLAPDLEALRLAERDVYHVGPRPLADPALLAAVRDAIKAGAGLRFQYDGRPARHPPGACCTAGPITCWALPRAGRSRRYGAWTASPRPIPTARQRRRRLNGASTHTPHNPSGCSKNRRAGWCCASRQMRRWRRLGSCSTRPRH